MNRIWLIGMMGTGKTTAGELAAERLDVSFSDTDVIVTELAGRSIPELWLDGEERFRELERMVVGKLAETEGIIATGGGAVLDPANREAMEGTVVWLEASPETILSRIEGTDRPLLASSGDPLAGIEGLLEERHHLYVSLADHRIVTDGLPADEVATRIESLWPG